MSDYSYLIRGDECKIIFANSTFLIITRKTGTCMFDISIDTGTSKPSEKLIIKLLNEARGRYR
jgi:hypothetical protein